MTPPLALACFTVFVTVCGLILVRAVRIWSEE